jgi:EAL domain-containing protein (putative c-di-GMP-specific phosphodiesterase class I)
MTRLNVQRVPAPNTIDDFGTGYSSLAYLQRLPTNNIKIDKSFVLKLAENTNDVAIVKSIIDLGHNLGQTILAEGVEHESVLEILSQLHCDSAQGYYMSKPLPVRDIDAWVSARVRSDAPDLRSGTQSVIF